MDYVETGRTYAGQTRQVRLELGREYIVLPVNKLKLKHRDRHCKLISLQESIYNGRPCGYWVHFLDNGRRGKVDAGDLVPVRVHHNVNGSPISETPF